MLTIQEKKTIVPALDVSSLQKALEVVSATCKLDGIGGYKLGFTLALRYGLPKIVSEIRKLTGKPLIYDHQKAATDIPDTGEDFAKACAESGVDAIILFPQAGPKTLEAWIRYGVQSKLKVIVGLEMTHPAYLEQDGGFLSDSSPQKILEIALREGVTEFVVPGNKPQKILEYRQSVEKTLQAGQYALYSPGLVAQGGKISESAVAAGERWHAIIGRGIYSLPGPEQMTAVAQQYCSALRV